MTFSSGEEFKLNNTVADCFLVDGTVTHLNEFIESPAVINHSEGDKSATNEVQESVVFVPERAVFLVVKQKHSIGKQEANGRTSMHSQETTKSSYDLLNRDRLIFNQNFGVKGSTSAYLVQKRFHTFVLTKIGMTWHEVQGLHSRRPKSTQQDESIWQQK